MRVLMLGWEFPPFITGGLGTACYGLTRALERRGIDVTFVLPKHVDAETTSHVTLISPATEWVPGQPVAQVSDPRESAGTGLDATSLTQAAVSTALVLGQAAPLVHAEDSEADVEDWDASAEDLGATAAAATPRAAPLPRRLRILGTLGGPYVSGRPATQFGETRDTRVGAVATAPAGSMLEGARFLSRSVESHGLMPVVLQETLAAERALHAAIPEAHGQAQSLLSSRSEDYGGDLVGDAYRYARFVVAACGHLAFDVIHAHDWLTYPAGLALAQVTGRPLVAHVHSTEFDRSGLHVNQRVYDIERRGMHGAIKVVSVSMLTKNLCINRYGVPGNKIEVVYNGVELSPEQVGMEDIQAKDKIVLYFGRITMQKGPEYFVQAAKRVLEVHKDVKFVVAGSGDQAQRMIEMAAGLGIGHKMLFTGFLRGKDIARVFALADLYVMPSVSEPFGIAPLEAMSHDVPVLISRTSGVSEVLTHALKCDFWDVDEMANKIVAVLRYPPLQRTLIEHGRFEVRKLTWDGAAARCTEVYEQVLPVVGSPRR